MKYAIAIKDNPNPNKPYMGYIKPLIKEENGKFLSVNPETDFPNRNSIVVFNTYDHIDKNFDANELFKISYSDAEPTGTMRTEDSNYSYYQANGYDAKKNGELELFHIIEENVDFSNRQVLSFPYKPIRSVFVQQEELPEFLFGPFRPLYEQNLDGSYTIQLEPYPKLTQISSSKDWFILKVARAMFKTITIDSQKIWMCSIQNLADTDYEIVDFISEEQLIKWANGIIPSENRIAKQDLNKLKNSLKSVQKHETEETKARLERAIDIFDSLEVWQEDRSTLINQFLSTQKGENSINKYLNANRQAFENELENKYRDKKAEYEKETSELEQKMQAQKDALEKLKTEFSETQDSINQRKQEELDEQRLELQSDVDNLHAQLKSLKKNLEILEDIKDIKSEVGYWERRKGEMKQENSKLEQQRRQLSRGVQEDQNELLKKLTELKSYIDVLNGLGPSSSPQTKKHTTIAKRQNIPGSLNELISEVQLTLQTYGRDYDTESLANYLINIQQSFLTILSGLPGSGKTSLVTYLAKSLGLEINERILFIPVARGWTSQKNLLGFFNPLNGKFQPSTTGMYEALSRMQDEEESAYPYWVLLDEANLSSIEHYWSSFMAMCDSHRNKIIQLGDPQNSTLVIPNAVRFIATINNDNTTELLSPRIIDRAPVIKIQHWDNPSSANETIGYANKLITELLPQDTLSDLFMPKEGQGFDMDEERVFEDIENSLSEKSTEKYLPSIYISPRKRNMIENYCIVARGIMKKNKYDLRAIDRAVSQHVLPMINGNGGGYRERLDKLAKVLNEKGLTYSHSMLQQMITVGENQHHFYHFFIQ